VRGHFLNLNLVEFANSLVQALLYKALKDLLASSVLLDELRRIFRTIEG
jgi:hypothetical protein